MVMLLLLLLHGQPAAELLRRHPPRGSHLAMHPKVLAHAGPSRLRATHLGPAVVWPLRHGRRPPATSLWRRAPSLLASSRGRVHLHLGSVPALLHAEAGRWTTTCGSVLSMAAGMHSHAAWRKARRRALLPWPTCGRSPGGQASGHPARSRHSLLVQLRQSRRYGATASHGRQTDTRDRGIGRTSRSMSALITSTGLVLGRRASGRVTTRFPLGCKGIRCRGWPRAVGIRLCAP